MREKGPRPMDDRQANRLGRGAAGGAVDFDGLGRMDCAADLGPEFDTRTRLR